MQQDNSTEEFLRKHKIQAKPSRMQAGLSKADELDINEKAGTDGKEDFFARHIPEQNQLISSVYNFTLPITSKMGEKGVARFKEPN